MPDPPASVRIAGPPVDTLLREMLEDRWLTFGRRLSRARRKGSAAAIHDLRVATRRLLATLNLVSGVMVTKNARRIRRPARALLKTLNGLRDVQVQRGAVGRILRTRPLLRAYAIELRRREAVLLGEAAGTFRAFPLPQIEQDVSALAEEIDAAFNGPALRSAGLRVLQGSAAAAYGRAVHLRGLIRFDRPETLHRFRVAFKKYRYSIELLEPVFPWADRRLRRAMNRYQTALGEIQDLEVLSTNLRAFARRRRPPGRTSLPSFLPVYRWLERRRERVLTGFQSAVNEINRFWEQPVR